MRTAFLALLIAAAASGASAINCVSSGKVEWREESVHLNPASPLCHR